MSRAASKRRKRESKKGRERKGSSTSFKPAYEDSPLTKVGDIKVRVPTEISHITLGQYQEYIKTPVYDNITYKMILVSIFCNVPIDLVLEHCTTSQIQQAYTTIRSVIERLEDRKSYGKFNTTFKIGNITMGFEPNFENMKAGAFADLTVYFDKWDTMHNAMAILFRPIAKSRRNILLKIVQYELVPYTTTSIYAPLMKNMQASIAIQANFFLQSSFLSLRKLFLIYIKEKMLTMPELNTPQNRHLLTTGDGTKASTALQEIISLISEKQQT